MSAPTTFLEVAARVVGNGYQVVPIAPGKKYPAGLNDWEKFSYTPGCEKLYPKYGAGFLSETTPGVDVDVSDEDVVSRLENMVREVTGISEVANIPRRVGRWPRVLLPFRAEKPFAKKQTALYRLSTTPDEKKGSKVEILASGQQWVGYHIHPDTKAPYSWNGHDLLNTPWADLPLLTEAMADRIIVESEQILAEYGERIGEEVSDTAVKAKVGPTIEDGARNGTLFKLACSLRAKGLSQGAINAAVLAENRAKCNPPLPEHEALSAAASSARYPSGAETLDIKDLLSTARGFRATEFPPESFHFWQGQFYQHATSHFTALDPAGVRAVVYWYLAGKSGPDNQPIKPGRRMVDDVVDALRAAAYLNLQGAPAWLNGVAPHSISDLVACANGIVHIPTRTLIPATPKYFTLNALNFAFDPDAPAPVAWETFLQTLWPNDGECIDTLQEFLGYAVTLDTSQHKGLLIIGPKRSGKGTIARVFTSIVGAYNTAAPTLAGLGAPFGLQALIGKQLAIISDARLGNRADISAVTENVLRITGEDYIGVPRKHLSDFTARLPVRFIIMTNEVPALADASGALPSRFIVLRLTESFYGREDTKLTERLLAELPGIFLWALQGLERLRARGAFRQPDSARELIEHLEDLASPINCFIRDKCMVLPGASIETKRLFATWREWCQESNREHPGTEQVFGRNLAAAVPALGTSRPNVGGQRVRYYEGIRLRRTED